MRVLHIASGGLWAGAEVMLYNLVRGQQRAAGTEVAVVVLNEGALARSLQEAGVRTYVIPETEFGVLKLIAKCRSIMREFRPDVVHTHLFKEDFVGATAAFLTGGVTCVRTVHGIDEAEGFSIRRALSRVVHRIWARRFFAVTYAVSRVLQAELQNRFGLKSRYVPNGIDLDAISIGPGPIRKPETVTNVGIVARLVPVKRVDIFLEMAALVNQKAPGRFRFLVYGDGPQLAHLQDLAKRLDIEGVTRFAGFSSRIIEDMKTLHLLFLTSDSEGLPMVVLEAMSLGVPVVAHAVGELPSVLDHGSCGTLVDVHRAESYADAALRYLDDRSAFIEKAKKAEQRVREAYSADACATAYIAEYRTALEQRR